MHGSLYPIIYTVYDDTNTGEPKFKYVCDVYVGGTKVARLKTLPNENDYGVFQVNRIVDDFLESTKENQNEAGDPLIRLGVADATPFSKNLNSVRRVEFRFGTEQATSATADPTLTADRITGEYLVVIKSHGRREMATHLLDDFDSTSLTPLEPNGANDPFISVVPSASTSGGTIYTTGRRYDQDIESGQSHLISWLNDTTSSTSSGSVEYLHIGGYNSSGGTVFESTMQNNATNGGESPATANSDDERLIYFGSGMYNLAAQTLNSTISTGMGISSLAYYEIVAASSATLNSGTVRSAVYRFNIKSECKYPTRRVMFLNQYGGWDFYNFTKRSEKTAQSERTTFKGVRGNWATATDNFGWNHWERGTTTTKVDTKLTEKLNTDWIDEDWVPFFESMFSSREVYILEQKSGFDTYMVPVTITSSQFLRKSSVNDQLIQYEVNLEYANNLALG